MQEKITEIVEKLKTAFGQLDNKKKIILGAIGALIITALATVTTVTTMQGTIVLYRGLQPSDFASVTQKLQETGYQFTSSGTDTIKVDAAQRDKILMMLAQENMIPTGIPGYELFDEDKWSETQFEKDIKHQRAIMGTLSRVLGTLRSVEKADVIISIPESDLFEESVKPVTASVLLQFSAGIEELARKEIKGIERLVSRSVPGLKSEDVTISGPSGEILNDFDDAVDMERWKLKSVTEKLRIEEKERVKLLTDIRNSLQFSFGDGIYGSRFDIVRLDMKLRWDEEEIEKQEVAPVIMVPDNPATPYSELQTKDSLTVSSKTTSEEFVGNGFTPEGPAGTEPNIPPGYKDRDYQKANYNKKETIQNNEFNKIHRKIVRQPWYLEKINLAVIIDGQWLKKGEKEEGGGFLRDYKAPTEDELKAVEDLLKKAIGFNASRGDQLTVRHLQKDRSKAFEIEDEELERRKTTRRMLLATLISLLILALATILFQAIKRELERRRRLREEELAAQQQMMREAALRALEEEGVEVELSLEERARREMLENAVSLAKDRPEDVALLLRTWLAED